MPTVILCRPLHPTGMALLESRSDVTVRTLNRPTQAELAAAMPGGHAVLVGLEEVDEALLSHSPDLRIVSRFGVGEGTGGGMMMHPMPEKGSAWLPYVLVGDIAAATAKAKSLGATIIKDVTEVMGAGALSIFVDPTGAVLGLWQPKAR
jgi:predicted enzyme related to lactoylglutathione lyase